MDRSIQLNCGTIATLATAGHVALGPQLIYTSNRSGAGRADQDITNKRLIRFLAGVVGVAGALLNRRQLTQLGSERS